MDGLIFCAVDQQYFSKNFQRFFFQSFFFSMIFKAFLEIFQRFFKHFLKEFFRDFFTLFFFPCVLFQQSRISIRTFCCSFKQKMDDWRSKMSMRRTKLSEKIRCLAQKIAENRRKCCFLKKFRTFIKNGTRPDRPPGFKDLKKQNDRKDLKPCLAFWGFLTKWMGKDRAKIEETKVTWKIWDPWVWTFEVYPGSGSRR